MTHPIEHLEPSVGGLVLDAWLAAFGSYRKRGAKVLARHCGVEEISEAPDALFPLRGFLGGFNEMEQQLGAPFMESIGAKVAERIAYPPGTTLAQALAMTNELYYAQHAGVTPGQIGGYVWEPASNGRGGIMTVRGPYLCSLGLGAMRGVLRRFDPAARVEHGSDGCRSNGAPACRYITEW